MEKEARKNFKGFRKVLAYISMFAMMLGLIEPAFVMKVEAATVPKYAVTVNIYQADQANLEDPPQLPSLSGDNTYHAVVSLKSRTTGEVAAWGYANIDPSKATQTVYVDTFYNMDNLHEGQWNEQNARHTVIYNTDEYYSPSVRIYHGQDPEIKYNSWDNQVNSYGLSYNKIVEQKDTIDGYKFLKQTKNDTPVITETGTTSAVINLAKDNGTDYIIHFDFPTPMEIKATDYLYVLTTVEHKSNSKKTYFYHIVETNGTVSSYEILADKWYDGNGDDDPTEKYSGNEKSVSVKLVKGNASVPSSSSPKVMVPNILNHENNFYDVVDETEILNSKVKYPTNYREEFNVDGNYKTTHYQDITMTKHSAAQDYNSFEDILGNAINYGVVANVIDHQGHSETNLATKLYKGGHILESDLCGDGNTPVPGTFIIGAFDETSYLHLGGSTPPTPIVIVGDGADSHVIKDSGCPDPIRVTMPVNDVNSIVEEKFKASKYFDIQNHQTSKFNKITRL